MDPLTLIINVIIAGLVCVILYFVCAAVIEQIDNNPKWQKINKLLWLVIFLIWLLSIVAGRVYLISFHH